MQIILASGSPRRQQLLKQAGVDFTVLIAQINEQQYPLESASEYLTRMVNSKAQAAIAKFAHNKGCRHTSQQMFDKPDLFNARNILFVTADTIGLLPDGRQILTKPKNKSDAITMWRQMSGQTHHVLTAVQVSLVKFLDEKNKEDVDANKSSVSKPILVNTAKSQVIVEKKQLIESTAVTFITLTENQMHSYWQTGEPADKAGAYAIQGRAAAWVKRINGSYTNVVGLPLAQTLTLIEQMRSSHKTV